MSHSPRDQKAAPRIDLPPVRRGAEIDMETIPDLVERSMPTFMALVKSPPGERAALIRAGQDVLLDPLTVRLCVDYLLYMVKRTSGPAAARGVGEQVAQLVQLLELCRAVGIEAACSRLGGKLGSPPPPAGAASPLKRGASPAENLAEGSRGVAVCRDALSVLERQEGGGDDAARRLARATARLAMAMAREGDPAAEPHARKAIAQLPTPIDDGDGADVADHVTFRWTLSSVVNSAGRPAEALACLDQAVDAARRATSEAGRAFVVGVSQRRRADILSEIGRRAEALAAYEEAIRLLEGSPDSGLPAVRIELAAAFGNQADVQVGLGDGALQDAVASSARAIALYELLVTDEGLVDLAHELARALIRYSDLLDPSQVVESLPLLRRAVDLYASMPATAPERRQVVPALDQLASALRRASRWDDAREVYGWLEAHCDEVLAHTRDPTGVRAYGRYRAEATGRIGSILVLAGRADEARARYLEAAEVLKRIGLRSEVRQDLASLYAQAAAGFRWLGQPERVAEFEAALSGLGPDESVT